MVLINKTYQELVRKSFKFLSLIIKPFNSYAIN